MGEVYRVVRSVVRRVVRGVASVSSPRSGDQSLQLSRSIILQLPEAELQTSTFKSHVRTLITVLSGKSAVTSTPVVTESVGTIGSILARIGGTFVYI